MQLCNYQSEVAELFAELRKDPLASDANLGTAKDMTNDQLAELVCAAFVARDPKTKFSFETNWKTLVSSWFVLSCYAGLAVVLSGVTTTMPNNAFIDTMVEVVNIYIDRHV